MKAIRQSVEPLRERYTDVPTFDQPRNLLTLKAKWVRWSVWNFLAEPKLVEVQANDRIEIESRVRPDIVPPLNRFGF